MTCEPGDSAKAYHCGQIARSIAHRGLVACCKGSHHQLNRRPRALGDERAKARPGTRGCHAVASTHRLCGKNQAAFISRVACARFAGHL
jgi:hypothetical protein